jgi:hypothetical protein
LITDHDEVIDNSAIDKGSTVGSAAYTQSQGDLLQIPGVDETRGHRRQAEFASGARAHAVHDPVKLKRPRNRLAALKRTGITGSDVTFPI